MTEPKRMTAERLTFIQNQFSALVATLAEDNQTPGHWATYVGELILELAVQAAEIEALRHDIERHVKITGDQAEEIVALMQERDAARAKAIEECAMIAEKTAGVIVNALPNQQWLDEALMFADKRSGTIASLIRALSPSQGDTKAFAEAAARLRMESGERAGSTAESRRDER